MQSKRVAKASLTVAVFRTCRSQRLLEAVRLPKRLERLAYCLADRACFQSTEETMCICQTAFEVTMLAAWCLAYHALTIASILLTKSSYETPDYIMLVYAGASGAIALMLLLGTMTSNKGLVDLFLCFAKIRLLLYCLLAAFLAYEIITHKDSKYLLARLPATKATAMELFGIDLGPVYYLIPVVLGILADAFVIYRVQVFSENQLGKQP
ncbi:hypothetical protein MTO96_023000 [Rhipicephalus appendiculatus]